MASHGPHLYLLIAYQGSISVSALNDSSTSNQNGSGSRAEAQSSPGLTSELFAPCLNSCSPGSAEEVSSQIMAINNETNSVSQPDWVQHCNQAALRKLKVQLSLEDREDHDVDAKDIPSNSEPITVYGIQNEEPGTCRNLADVFSGLEFSKENHPEETGLPFSSTIDVLKNSGAIMPLIPILPLTITILDTVVIYLNM